MSPGQIKQAFGFARIGTIGWADQFLGAGQMLFAQFEQIDALRFLLDDGFVVERRVVIDVVTILVELIVQLAGLLRRVEAFLLQGALDSVQVFLQVLVAGAIAEIVHPGQPAVADEAVVCGEE